MEWWNDGILVFKRILTILILSSIPAGGGTIVPTLHYPRNPAGGGTIIPTLHYPRTHYSTIPAFQLGEAPKFDIVDWVIG